MNDFVDVPQEGGEPKKASSFLKENHNNKMNDQIAKDDIKDNNIDYDDDDDLGLLDYAPVVTTFEKSLISSSSSSEAALRRAKSSSTTRRRVFGGGGTSSSSRCRGFGNNSTSTTTNNNNRNSSKNQPRFFRLQHQQENSSSPKRSSSSNNSIKKSNSPTNDTSTTTTTARRACLFGHLVENTGSSTTTTAVMNSSSSIVHNSDQNSLWFLSQETTTHEKGLPLLSSCSNDDEDGVPNDSLGVTDQKFTNRGGNGDRQQQLEEVDAAAAARTAAYSSRRGGWSEHKKAPPPPSHPSWHTRSASCVSTMSSSTSSSLQLPPAIPSARRILQRSHSLALGDRSSNTNTRPSWMTQLWSSGGDDEVSRREEWEENMPPQMSFNAIEEEQEEGDAELEFSNQKKKLRSSQQRQQRRRHSITSLVQQPVVSTTTTLSSSTVATRSLSCFSARGDSSSLLSSSASQLTLPSDLSWLVSSSSSSSQQDVARLNRQDSFSGRLPEEDGAGPGLSLFNSTTTASSGKLSPTDYSSTAMTSTSSSRKRGVCESPELCFDNNGDNDDWLTTTSSSISAGGRRTRARSRIFVAPPGMELPMVPSLFSSSSSSHNNHSNNPGTSMSQGPVMSTATIQSSSGASLRGRQRRGRGADAMDVDDDDDSCCDDDNSDDEHSSSVLNHSTTTPDSSFEFGPSGALLSTEKNADGGNDPVPEPALVVPEDDDLAQQQRIQETMPSVEDLSYMIQQLQENQSRSQHQHATISTTTRLVWGAGNGGGLLLWKVVPSAKWPSQRRAKFMGWAQTHLGCTVRSLGMGFTILQISQTRGERLLQTLLATQLQYEQQQLQSMKEGQDSGVKNDGTPSDNMDGADDDVDDDTPPTFFIPSTVKKPDRSTSILPIGTVKSTLRKTKSKKLATHDTDADELMYKVSSLSISTDRISTVGQPISRQVTLPPTDDVKRDESWRLSIESITSKTSTSRPSMEGQTMELNFHLFGHSPRHCLGRPPKMSIGSTTSSCSVESTIPLRRGGGRFGTPRPNETPCSTVSHFVSTPLTCRDRGWGSRPVEGKDWGASVACDDELIVQLLTEFAVLCGDQGMRDELDNRNALDPIDDVCRDTEVVVEYVDKGAEKATERKIQKRMKSMHKRHRMSLFATATGANALVASRQSYALSVIQPDLILELDDDDDNSGDESVTELVVLSEPVMRNIFSFLDEADLMAKVTPVCTKWFDWATLAHADMLVTSVACLESNQRQGSKKRGQPMLERSWNSIQSLYPWACFLAEGGAKKVYKAFNSVVEAHEVVSVMDTFTLHNMQILANELAVAAMVNSLVRRGICPNFVTLRGVFSSAQAPSDSYWGCETKKYPRGKEYHPRTATASRRPPREPKKSEPGRYYYMRMELIAEGDAEECMKRQTDQRFSPDVARCIMFQVAFALYAAADRFSLKHYDVKLNNVFLQTLGSSTSSSTGGDLTLRYGLGSHVFALRMPAAQAYVAKLADFGTSNISPLLNGLPVTIAHFTTLENTPPDFMILGDDATQGHEHDCFGLGLSMLHLFTGSRPYEEILEDVVCPPNLHRQLRAIWENEDIDGYSVIRSVIFDGVDKDHEGNIVEGTPDRTFYDTLYRYLVLFGIPKDKFQCKTCPRVWKAIVDTLEVEPTKTKLLRRKVVKPARKQAGKDVAQYHCDCQMYSVQTGNHQLLRRARETLHSMGGGMELLLALCDFNPQTRATAMDVLNSTWMTSLREVSHNNNDQQYRDDTTTATTATQHSYMHFATTTA